MAMSGISIPSASYGVRREKPKNVDNEGDNS